MFQLEINKLTKLPFFPFLYSKPTKLIANGQKEPNTYYNLQ